MLSLNVISLSKASRRSRLFEVIQYAEALIIYTKRSQKMHANCPLILHNDLLVLVPSRKTPREIGLETMVALKTAASTWPGLSLSPRNWRFKACSSAKLQGGWCPRTDSGRKWANLVGGRKHRLVIRRCFRDRVRGRMARFCHL